MKAQKALLRLDPSEVVNTKGLDNIKTLRTKLSDVERSLFDSILMLGFAEGMAAGIKVGQGLKKALSEDTNEGK